MSFRTTKSDFPSFPPHGSGGASETTKTHLCAPLRKHARVWRVVWRTRLSGSPVGHGERDDGVVFTGRRELYHDRNDDMPEPRTWILKKRRNAPENVHRTCSTGSGSKRPTVSLVHSKVVPRNSRTVRSRRVTSTGRFQNQENRFYVNDYSRFSRARRLSLRIFPVLVFLLRRNPTRTPYGTTPIRFKRNGTTIGRRPFFPPRR